MFGDWLIPKFAKSYRCIAMDTAVGDIGRSCPKDQNPKIGPSTEQEVGNLALEVIRALEFPLQDNKKINLVGYSMGAFLDWFVAQTQQDFVNKVVLIVPASTLAPARTSWIFEPWNRFGITSQI